MHIGYYQWVPIVLLVQAFLFYLPCLLWRVFSDRSGINVNNLVEAAETIQNALYPERRDKTIKYMIRHLDHYLDYQREYRGGCCVTCKHFFAKHMCLVCGNRYGNYLVALYMMTKVLYFSNTLLQLFMLDGFLGTEYHFYGFEIIKQMILGRKWTPSRSFPRITLCDFSIRQMGNTHPHTVQCVLPINLFNEKIYIFLWFWFVFIAASTCFSFLRWLWIIGFRYSRIRYIRRHLKIMDKLNRDSDRDKKLSHKFTEMYLRQDGVFALKLVAKNSTELVVADIVSALWDNYRNKQWTYGLVMIWMTVQVWPDPGIWALALKYNMQHNLYISDLNVLSLEVSAWKQRFWLCFWWEKGSWTRHNAVIYVFICFLTLLCWKSIADSIAAD